MLRMFEALFCFFCVGVFIHFLIGWVSDDVAKANKRREDRELDVTRW